MGQKECRLYSKRLEFEISSDARKRLSQSEAIRAFEARTGFHPEATEVKRLVVDVTEGLAQRAEGDTSEWILAPGSETEVLQVWPDARKGRPSLPGQLVLGIRALVEKFGPTDSALLLLIYGLDRSSAFPLRKKNREGEGFDVSSHVIRPLAKRLSKIAKSELPQIG